MKSTLFLLTTLLAIAARSSQAQGTFIYDQQSSSDEFIPNYGAGGDMEQIPSPWGQSFTPSLAGIDFIRLKIGANSINPGFAIMHLDLHSDSMYGPVIGSTDPLIFQTGFRGNPTFFFPTTVALSPGNTYYFEGIIAVTQGLWRINSGPFGYAGGSGYVGGVHQLATDLWFREGTYEVPEPASGALLLLAGGAAALARRARP